MIQKLQSKELKKHVAAIRISNDVGLVPRKAWNVLLLNAYNELGSHQRHEIPVSILCDVIEYKSKNFGNLKRGLVKLMSTVVTWDIGGGAMVKGAWCENFISSSLLSEIRIVDGILYYGYSKGLAELLHEPEIYQKINIAQQNLFNTTYGLALWENCIRFIGTGSTGFSDVDEWRELLGATSKSYSEYKSFNSKVLQPAIKEVNKVSNIEIALRTKKRGRKIIEIGFSIKEKKQKNLLSLDRLQELENSQEYKDMQAYGIHHVDALRWLDKYGNNYICEKLAFTKEQDQNGIIKKSVSGFLRRAIEEDYKSEKDVKKNQELEQRKKQQAAEHQRKLEQQRKKLEVAFIKQAKQEYISGLPDKEKEVLLEEARKAYEDNPAILNMIKDINSPIVEGYLTQKIPNLETRKEAYIKENLKM